MNPALSFSWACVDSGSAPKFIVHDPVSNRSCLVRSDEFWVVELLNQLASQPGTKEEYIAAARRLVSFPEHVIESTLARLWSIIFIPEKAAEELGRGIDVWERFDSKLAFECFAQCASVGDRRGASAANQPADHDRGTRSLPLPAPTGASDDAFGRAIYQRRTCRDFDSSSVPLATFSSVLFQGVTVAPAEVMLPAFSWYVIAVRVEALQSGVYAYLPRSHGLRPIRFSPYAEIERDLIRMQIGQQYARGGAFALMLSASIETLFNADQGPAVFRRWLVCAGAAAQRLVLSGVAQGLHTFPSAAFNDDLARSMVGGEIDDVNIPTHCIVFGNSSRAC